MHFKWQASKLLSFLQIFLLVLAMIAVGCVLSLSWTIILCSLLLVKTVWIRPPEIKALRLAEANWCYLYFESGQVELASLQVSSVITHRMLYLVFKTLTGKRRCCIARGGMDYAEYRMLTSHVYHILSKSTRNR